MLMPCIARLFGIRWPERWTADPEDVSSMLDAHVAAERSHAIRAHTRQEDTGSGAPPRISNFMAITPASTFAGDEFDRARSNGWDGR